MSRGAWHGIGPGPGLLVSVRSAAEAREAVAGGAAVVDVKEPDRGPLGAADPAVWRSVREAVPPGVPVSVALGELRDWIDRPTPPPSRFEGIAWRKLGLSGMAGSDWVTAWARLRDRFGAGPDWVAVAYLDGERAASPRPDEVRAAALEIPECSGVLLDTWDKSRPADFGTLSGEWVAAIRRSGRFVALAGGLDAGRIRGLGPFDPDLFAVRGAACADGDRAGRVDRDRVRALVGAIASFRVGEAGPPVGIVVRGA